MTSSEIQRLCIDSSSIYLEFLSENNKGRSEIRIYSIDRIGKSDNLFKLQLGGKIFDLDAILFRYGPSNVEIDTSKILIREYDIDRNILIVKVTESVPFKLALISPDDLLVISDLKFLVKRVYDYFIKHGNKIKLPKRISNPNIQIADFKFISAQPNSDQQEALLNVFKNSLSYIWGAPGTGKTRYVLAQSAIKYMEDGKRIAVFAPTNVALEQVLSGVIEITDKAGIKRDKIIRIGNPSRQFAAAFPEVCEVAGAQKKIEEINRVIKIVQIVLGVDEESQDEYNLQKLRDISRLVLKHEQSLRELERELNKTKDLVTRLQNGIATDRHFKNSKENQILAQEKRLTSFTRIVINFLNQNGNNALRKRIGELQNELHEILFQIEQNESELESVKLTLSSQETSRINILSELSRLSSKFTNIKFNSAKLNSLLEGATLDTLPETIPLLEVELELEKENREINATLRMEYSKYSKAQLNDLLSNLVTERDRISQYDTQERIKRVQVIGATLDGYIGRFPEADLNVDHLFLDEAGYANIVKGLSLFVYDYPITLLGDHMQLPPVCEMNEGLFQEPSKQDAFIWAASAINYEGIFTKTKAVVFNEFRWNQNLNFDIVRKSNLTKTHRFGQNLAAILDKYVYNQMGFRSSNRNGVTEIRFVHAKKMASQEKRVNINEISAIEAFIKSISTDNFSIITPYNNQVKALMRRMPEVGKDLKILTVHKSQGREWDTVILSVCDTSDKWFTDSQNPSSRGKNLINTAVSRARKRLVIVCDYEYWINQEGQLLQGLLTVASPVN